MTRTTAGILMSVVAAITLTGCGGGGDSAASDPAAAAQQDIANAQSGVAAANAATGARSGDSTPQADVSFAGGVLGVPGSVETGRNATVLDNLDRLGTPKDIFRAQVTDAVAAPTTTAPAAGPVGTPEPTTTAPTTTTAAPEINPLQADFDVDGEPILAREGDSIPPDTQQFLVKTIAKGGVTLVLNGGLLPNGSDTLKLGVGQSIILKNQTAGESYRIRLAGIQNAR